MFYLLIKATVAGALIASVSEVASRYPGSGGLVASLPLCSLLAIVWLYKDSGDRERGAALAVSNCWFVLVSLPLLLAFAALIRSGMAFWLALGLSIAEGLLLYELFFWIAPKVGIRL